jgi:hypothetical protein
LLTICEVSRSEPFADHVILDLAPTLLDWRWMPNGLQVPTQSGHREKGPV